MPRVAARGAVAGLVLAVVLSARAVAAQTVLDEFEELTGWSTQASEGATIELAHDAGRAGMGMRIDFDFHGSGGYVIARKAFTVNLPANYAFTFQAHGQAPANNLEFKVVDRTGQNVWWYQRRDFVFPPDWAPIEIRQRRLQFAWGPAGGGAPKRVSQVEIALTAAEGGKGSIWIDDLKIEEHEAAAYSAARSHVRASTSAPGSEPGDILDEKADTAWRSGSVASSQWVLVDFGRTTEFGGLMIDWDVADYATAYQVEVSDDGENWKTSFGTTTGNGGRDYVYMPDSESRFVRIGFDQSSRGQGYAIRELTVKPYEFSSSPNRFMEEVARDAPYGTYPKYLSGRQTYWTVVGVNGDGREALLNEEGMLEVDKGAFSIEPFLFADGTLVTWNSVNVDQYLADGYLPIPSVSWRWEHLTLTVTVFAAGQPGASTLYATYRVANTGDAYHTADLYLAIRPFQVVPPWQSLNMTGGVSAIRDLGFEGRMVWVNQSRPVVSLTPPERFGATTFEQGSITEFLTHGRLPLRTEVSDPFGYASGALQYTLRLDPQAYEEVTLAVPLHEPPVTSDPVRSEETAADVRTLLGQVKREWDAMLRRAEFRVPTLAEVVPRTIKTTLAYILINRDGPAIQPGSRNYARSWIRDGAVSSAALLEMGFTEEAREFIRWFADHQFPDGKIPCCIDRRGADPVSEHDSNGEFIYTVAEYYRFTRDVGFLNDMWPAVVRSVEYLSALRQRRLTEEYRQPDKLQFYGLLPESISHEGYSAHPVHSYWDDFFALRGFKDAAALAAVVGDEDRAAAYAALRDAFRTDLYASIARTIEKHKIDYMPASAELGDFDPTSTAVAVSCASELANLPQDVLRRTFDLYYQHVRERSGNTMHDDAYSAYELRNVELFVRLGDRARANEILDLMLADMRPRAWNEWQEVTWRNPEAPQFIGDMPHTWIGASFLRAVRSMFVYEKESDRSLVLAAGLRPAWVMTDPGVAVKRLPTHYGTLSYTLRAEEPNRLRWKLAGDVQVPPGQIVLEPPLPAPLKSVTVNGRPIETFTAERALVGEFPADVVMEY